MAFCQSQNNNVDVHLNFCLLTLRAEHKLIMACCRQNIHSTQVNSVPGKHMITMVEIDRNGIYILPGFHKLGRWCRCE